MTDNELTAAIGKLFGWVEVGTSKGTTRRRSQGSSHDRWFVRTPKNRDKYDQCCPPGWQASGFDEEPTNEQVGRLLLEDRGIAYAINPTHFLSILAAAANAGIIVSVEGNHDDKTDEIKWEVWARSVENAAEHIWKTTSGQLQRTLCRAILKAKGIKVGNVQP